MTVSPLMRAEVVICEQCLQGEGDECHTPGCVLWMNRPPDFPIDPVWKIRIGEAPDAMVRVDGEPFRCQCGGNVFKKTEPDTFSCNSCSRVWRGE